MPSVRYISVNEIVQQPVHHVHSSVAVSTGGTTRHQAPSLQNLRASEFFSAPVQAPVLLPSSLVRGDAGTITFPTASSTIAGDTNNASRRSVHHDPAAGRRINNLPTPFAPLPSGSTTDNVEFSGHASSSPPAAGYNNANVSRVVADESSSSVESDPHPPDVVLPSSSSSVVPAAPPMATAEEECPICSQTYDRFVIKFTPPCDARHHTCIRCFGCSGFRCPFCRCPLPYANEILSQGRGRQGEAGGGSGDGPGAGGGGAVIVVDLVNGGES